MFGGWGEKDQRAEQGQGITFSFCPYLLWEMEFAFDCNGEGCGSISGHGLLYLLSEVSCL